MNSTENRTWVGLVHVINVSQFERWSWFVRRLEISQWEQTVHGSHQRLLNRLCAMSVGQQCEHRFNRTISFPFFKGIRVPTIVEQAEEPNSEADWKYTSKAASHLLAKRGHTQRKKPISEHYVHRSASIQVCISCTRASNVPIFTEKCWIRERNH